MDYSLVTKAKLMLAKSPTQAAAAQVWWNAVCDALHAHYIAQRPKPKSFEVHHANETARAAFLQALVDGADFPACKAAALARIGIDEVETARK